jgi:hypothetical protein
MSTLLVVLGYRRIPEGGSIHMAQRIASKAQKFITALGDYLSFPIDSGAESNA